MIKPELKAISLLLVAMIMPTCAHRAGPPGPPLKPKLMSVQVKKGDTLQEMGELYSVSRNTLERLNGLRPRAEIKPGQIIYIPVSEKSSMSSDLWGSDRLVRSVSPEGTGLTSDDDSTARGERQSLYAEMRQLHWPLDGRLSSGFGPRSGRRHAGIDIMAPKGQRIRAAHTGVVEYAGWRRGYGWTVIVKQRSYKTLYAHCSKLLVKKNDLVKKGQHIALVGASGNAEGSHLHFEYKTLADRSLDPMPHFAREYAH